MFAIESLLPVPVVAFGRRKKKPAIESTPIKITAAAETAAIFKPPPPLFCEAFCAGTPPARDFGICDAVTAFICPVAGKMFPAKWDDVE